VEQAVSIIVNGDDVGAHQVFTDASIAALESGGISSVSVITPGPDADRALTLLKDHPEYEVGVHLSLNGDWAPLAPRGEVPSLYNGRGTMWDTEDEVVANVRPDEARIEWEAQLRKALDAGVRVTHLDSHMGCYFLTDELFAAGRQIAEEYQIPMITPYIPHRMSTRDRQMFALASYGGIYRLRDAEETFENRSQAYLEFLKGLSPGIHYIYTHHAPTNTTDPTLGDLPLRINDYAYWTGEESRRHLDELGIQLVGASVLREPFLAGLQ
jgi:predicted glycoside hydrolase/deacetylase ChbG (UPF0249 family)